METKQASFTRRLVLVILGNFLIGLGTSILRLSGFGTDPFSCMNLGVSSHLPISFGLYQMLFNIVLFIPIFILDRKSFGIGALINMLCLGYVIDALMMFYGLFGITIEGLAAMMALRVLLMIVGVLVVCLGVAIYMDCDMGAAPYDRLAVVIESLSHGKIQFRWARVAYDILAICIGFFTGSVVGPATVIIGFFTGPIVSFLRKTLVRRMMA